LTKAKFHFVASQAKNDLKSRDEALKRERFEKLPSEKKSISYFLFDSNIKGLFPHINLFYTTFNVVRYGLLELY
jgi:hypothetical protein